MEIARIIIACSLSVCGLCEAVAEVVMQNEKTSIAIVEELLTRIKDNKTMSYDEEILYFGDQTILSHVLLLKNNLVDGAGRWISTNRVSLLGRVLKANAEKFCLSKNAVFSYVPCKSQNGTSLVCIVDTCFDQKAYFDDRRILKNIVFCVQHSEKGEKIDLARSSVDGMGVPAVLGFSSEIQLVKTYGGKRKSKWMPVYKGSFKGKSSSTNDSVPLIE